MKSGQGNGDFPLLAVNDWLQKAAGLRHAKHSDQERASQRIQAERSAQSILMVREAEELLTELRAWINSYEIEHAELARLVRELLAASTPGPNGSGHKHWSIAEELPDGRSGKFRAALNALMKHWRG
jgi:hypothetical protein